jgi:hypothetical protein
MFSHAIIGSCVRPVCQPCNSDKRVLLIVDVARDVAFLPIIDATERANVTI